MVTRADPQHPSEFIRSLAGQSQAATAFFCEGNSCRPPVAHPADLIRELKQSV